MLLVNEVPVFGGVNRVVQCLWDWLPRLGVEADVLVRGGGDAGQTRRFVDEWFGGRPEGVRVLPPPRGGRLRAAWGNARGVGRHAAEYDVTNLHFNTVEGTVVPAVVAARRAGRRVVLTYHHLNDATDATGRRRLALRLALRLASDVVVSTPIMADRVRRLRPSARVHVVPLGVDPPAKTYDRDALRRKFDVPAEAVVIGHLSRLAWHKGLPKVVAAVRALLDNRPNLFLLACGGDHPDAPRLIKLLERELPGRSRMLGFVADHHEMLACCDIFAVPSGWEGFGLVYVEAALHGLPRVGTRMGGVPFVIEDGVDGLLVTEGDAEELADVLARLHDDAALRRRLGDAAEARALREFTAEQMARRYADLVLAGADV